MSAGDGRHKFGSAAERELHIEIVEETRLMVERWIVSRRSQHHLKWGVELKKAAFQQELADSLGVSTRQLSAYCRDVPITLAKAVLLSNVCGDERLLKLFAHRMGAVAVALPPVKDEIDLGRANQELADNMREFSEAHGAALTLSDGKVEPHEYAAIKREGMEAVCQMLRVILIAEMMAHGETKTPLTSWAMRRRETAPGQVQVPCTDPTQPRPGWEPDIGFEGQDRERRD